MGTPSNGWKDAALNLIVTRLGSGAKIKLRTSGDADLIVLPLADPVGTVASQLLTLDFDPDIGDTATGAGTCTKFVLTTSADAIEYTGTAGTSGTELILTDDVIAIGQTVEIQSGTIVFP